MDALRRTHSKTNRRLGAILAVLIAVALGQKLTGGGVFDRDVELGGKMFEEFEPGSVAKLILEEPGRYTELRYIEADERWVLENDGGREADRASVMRILTELYELPSGRIASKDLSRIDRFELGENQGVKVRAFDPDGAILATLHIGKKGSDLRSTFVRRGDEEVVRRVDRNIVSAFVKGSSPTDSWRDRTVVDIGESEEVVRIEIEGPQGRVVLAPDPTAQEDSSPSREEGDELWRVEGPSEGPLESWTKTNLCGHLNPLRAESWPEEEVTRRDAGLDPPGGTVRIVKESGEDVVLLFGDKVGKDRRYAADDRDGDVFLIADWIAEAFLKDPESFISRSFRKKQQSVLDLDPDVDRIIIEGIHGRIVLERPTPTSRIWNVVEPQAAKVALRRSVEMLRQLRPLLKDGDIVQETSPATLGLEPPKIRVRFMNEESEAARLDIGEEQEQGLFAVRVSGQEGAVLVREWRLEAFFQTGDWYSAN